MAGSDEFLSQTNASDEKTWSNATVLNHDSNRDFVLLFQFVAWGIVGGVVSVLGLVGNVFSICVLSHRRMQSSTSCYLTALGIYDSVLLLTQIVIFALYSIDNMHRIPGYADFMAFTQPYLYPIALTAQSCSIYTTVGFTVERYIAVCLPLSAAKTCTISRARKAVLLILIACVLFNLPRWFESQTVSNEEGSEGNRYSYVATKLGGNPDYQLIYHSLIACVVNFIIPFALLSILNTLLLRAIHQSANTQGRVTSRQRHENNLTVMLLSVVIVFLVCQILPIVDNFYHFLNMNQGTSTLISTMACLLVIVNSAINFYLYCVFGRKFRQVFCLMFCRCRPSEQNAHGHSLHSQTQMTGGSVYHKNCASVKRDNNHQLKTIADNGRVDKYGYERLHADSTGTLSKETVM
jgi:hypothetical protein